MSEPTDRRGSAGDGGPPPASALDRFKEHPLTSVAVDHATAVVVLFLLVTVAGVLCYRAIPKESFPAIEIPTIAVNTVYPGVAPSDMETLVTRPLEDELQSISEIDELTSTTVEGYSNVTAEFSTSVDMNEALQKVREKVDLARPELPEEAEDPTIVEFNTEEIPVMQVNLSGDFSLVRLKEIGEDVQDRLEGIPQVLRAELRGGREREVRVSVDLAKLKAHGLSFGQIVSAIRSENVDVPGGAIDAGAQEYLLRVGGRFDEPGAIEDVVVARAGGRAIQVRDLAEVEFGFADRESYARLNGSPVVTLSVVKRSGANVIETSDAVREAVAGMRAELPPGLVTDFTSEQSEEVHQMVTSLENNIVAGLLLILAVLLFFLGLRTSVFVAISIPTSMLLSFVVLWVVGISMNMVVLFSLILALGMLVDNAIVVVENIYRYVEEGWERKTAAKKATGEVATPIIVATATTLAAFAPLLFWPDVTGEFMKYLPLTLIVTLSSSLFVALVIVPTLCALMIPEGGAGGESRELTPAGRWTVAGLLGLALVLIGLSNPLTAGLLALTGLAAVALYRGLLRRAAEWFRTRGFDLLLRPYRRTLDWALDHRGAVMALSTGGLLASFALFGAFNQGVVFFPEDIPPGQAIVSLETGVGSRVQFTDELTRQVEAELPAVRGWRDVESMVTTVGGSGGGGFGGGGPSGPNESRITLNLVDYQERSQSSFETLRRLREVAGRSVAGAEVSVQEPQEGPPTGAPVSVEISGSDPDTLQRLSDRALRILREAPVQERLVDLESDMDEVRPELSVSVDRTEAALAGLSTSGIGNAVRAAVQGIEAGEYRTGEDEYDIEVRLREVDRETLSALEGLTVRNDRGRQVPLVSVADWDVEEGLGSIRRKDQERVATLTADVPSGYNSNAVLAEVQRALSAFEADLPAGYEMSYTGQNEQQAQASSFLSTAFAAALMLIGLLLVSEFDSVTKPVIILTSVVMSTAGVLVGLMLFRMPFSIVMTGVGIISLAGIVVNNAIVLVDYVEILRERDGLDVRDAVLEGGLTRFRPVVLTAVTTALGLVPLAMGLNFDFFGLYGSLSPDFYWGGEQAAWWGPMAIAVIVGILFATFLTLVVVPVMYSLVEQGSSWLSEHLVSSDGPARPTPAAAGDGAGAGDGSGSGDRRAHDRERPVPATSGAD